MKITSVAHQMHIKCGWYQIQGTRGYGAHCTPQEINRLINELGRDKYSYYVMSYETADIISDVDNDKQIIYISLPDPIVISNEIKENSLQYTENNNIQPYIWR